MNGFTRRLDTLAAIGVLSVVVGLLVVVGVVEGAARLLWRQRSRVVVGHRAGSVIRDLPCVWCAVEGRRSAHVAYQAGVARRQKADLAGAAEVEDEKALFI